MDARSVLPVTYRGICPICSARVRAWWPRALDASGVFKADTVLARHDETYMPREVADALNSKAIGRAQGAQAKR